MIKLCLTFYENAKLLSNVAEPFVKSACLTITMALFLLRVTQSEDTNIYEAHIQVVRNVQWWQSPPQEMMSFQTPWTPKWAAQLPLWGMIQGQIFDLLSSQKLLFL